MDGIAAGADDDPDWVIDAAFDASSAFPYDSDDVLASPRHPIRA
jgi:hypothetical protein